VREKLPTMSDTASPREALHKLNLGNEAIKQCTQAGTHWTTVLNSLVGNPELGNPTPRGTSFVLCRFLRLLGCGDVTRLVSDLFSFPFCDDWSHHFRSLRYLLVKPIPTQLRRYVVSSGVLRSVVACTSNRAPVII